MAVIRGSFQTLYSPGLLKEMKEYYKNPENYHPPRIPDIDEQWDMWMDDPTDETFTEWRARKKYG